MRRQLTPRRTLWAIRAVILGVAAVGGVSIYLHFRSRTPQERGTAALIEVYAKNRLVEARLSGGFHAGKYEPGATNLSVDSRLLHYAEDEFSEAANPPEAPGSEFLRGRYQLATGDAKEALELLRSASQKLSGDPDVQNDYGAALYQMGKYEDALDQFQDALRLKPHMPEALFNKALCFQTLLLRNQARTCYEQVIKVERDPTWKREMERRLTEVSQTIGPEITQQQIIEALAKAEAAKDESSERALFETNLSLLTTVWLYSLPGDYLKSMASQDARKAGRTLEELKLVGKLYSKFACDSSVLDLEQYLAALPTRDVSQELSLYTELESAIYLANHYKTSEAEPAAERLATRYASRKNEVFGFLAQFYLANCYYEDDNWGAALGVYQRTLSEVQSKPWTYFRYSLMNQIGIVYSILGRDSEAIRQYNLALAICPGLEDGKVLQYLGLAYWRLGNLPEALTDLRQSTSYFIRSGATAINLSTNYLSIADIYRLEGKKNLALLCAQAALDFATQSGVTEATARYVAEAASFTAEQQADASDFQGALRDLQVAFDAVDKSGKGELYTGPLTLTRAGSVEAKMKDWDKAIEYYHRAESEALSRPGDLALALNPLRGLAQAYRATGKQDLAAETLHEAIRLIEQKRIKITDARNRMSYLDATHGIYDDLIALDADEKSALSIEDGFEAAEQSRARTLFDEIQGSDRSPKALSASGAQITGTPSAPKSVLPTVSEVESSLSSNLGLLEYSVTDHGVYIFVVTKSGLDVVKKQIESTALDNLVAGYLEFLQDPSTGEAWKVPSRKLFQVLIQPVQELLKSQASICIVPDKSLNLLSFATLLDSSDKPLIDSYTLTYSPSAAVLVRCLAEERRKGRRGAEEILAVGNPSFDRTQFPNLEDLSYASIEATSIGALYDRKDVLTDDNATEARVRSLISNAEVIHLAVHCLVEEGSPWLAEAVLAKPRSANESATESSRDDGVLRLSEINELNLAKARLVVLSGCRSALGQYYRGEGVVSLVRPFIAAGVPTVVATLWSVESPPTEKLMVRFHQLRTRSGLSSAQALREAQLEAAASKDRSHPYYWGAFIVVGGPDPVDSAKSTN